MHCHTFGLRRTCQWTICVCTNGVCGSRVWFHKAAFTCHGQHGNIVSQTLFQTVLHGIWLQLREDWIWNFSVGGVWSLRKRWKSTNTRVGVVESIVDLTPTEPESSAYGRPFPPLSKYINLIKLVRLSHFVILWRYPVKPVDHAAHDSWIQAEFVDHV